MNEKCETTSKSVCGNYHNFLLRVAVSAFQSIVFDYDSIFNLFYYDHISSIFKTRDEKMAKWSMAKWKENEPHLCS